MNPKAPAEPFVYTVNIGLRHTDAVGIIFFPQYFEMMQDAAEAFLGSRGMPPSKIARDGHYILPLVHAECDFRAPSRWGDTLRIEVRVEKVGRRSFSLGYRFVNPDGTLGAEGRTSQVSTEKTTHKAIALPEELLHALGPTKGRND